MPRYDNSGPLDTQMLSAGDSFFNGVNARLRPDQLAPGELAYSQNGRMSVDGAWQTRKGIDSFGSVISSNTTALTLPFYLYESETITAAARVDTVVTVDLANIGQSLMETATTGTHLASQSVDIHPFASNIGTQYASCYVKANGRDRVQFGGGTSVNTGSTFVLPTAVFELSGSGTVVSGSGSIESVGNGWYRISVSKYIPGTDTTYVSTLRLYLVDTGTNTSYAGDITKGVYVADFDFRVGTDIGRYEPTTTAAGRKNKLLQSNNLSNASWTKTRATATSAAAVGPGRFVNGSIVYVSDISGSVSPTGNREITVVNGGQFTFTIPGATGSESYVLGGSPLVGSPRLEANLNEVYGSCLFSDPSDDNAEYFIEATYDKAVAISLDDGTSTDIAYPSGVTIQESVVLLQAFSKVYLFRDGATTLEWNGSLSGSPAFAKVANGNYTQPKVFTAANNTAASAGVVTVTEASHGLSVGDKPKIFDNGSTTLVEGQEYTVATVPTSGTFTFYADVDDFAATSVVLGVRQSNGRGYTHMPAPPWGVYHQRRLLVPFYYTTTGSSGSEVITDRDVRDEFLISDIFDADTYDQLQNQFKVTAGIADYLQWIHPFTDDNAVAFNRNSIHLISGLSGSLTDITIKEITREAGLVAQKSVVTIGNQIFFLSDNGVYATTFGDLYNLRGAGLPLSDPIDPIIKRINSAYAQNAVGCYHDNRYWLAVPLDGSTVNNATLVFNLLNGKWESVDIVEESGWDIANLIPAGAGGIKKLYAINSFGGIHIFDGREDDVDRLALYPGISATAYPIQSYVTSRQYNMGAAGRKKFNNFELHLESSASNASNGTISVDTENMDDTETLGTVSYFLTAAGDTAPLSVSEDASLRGRIGNIRGYGLQLTFTPSQGRPKLRLININAIPAFNSLTAAT